MQKGAEAATGRAWAAVGNAPGDEAIITLHHVRCVRVGAGALASCAADCAGAGAASVLVVTSPQIVALCAPLVRDLEGLGIAATVWSEVAGEPTRADLAAAIAVARACRADFVVF